LEPQRPLPPELCPNSLWGKLVGALETALPPQKFLGVKLLMGVSGGADSVALLKLVTDFWTKSSSLDARHLAVAHYNHQLRGEASDGDQAFVRELATSLGLDFHTKNATPNETANVAPESMKGGSEELFRSARYRYLQSTAESIGARYVLVAHTADDNIETMLHHLFRGTGARGLSGIAPHRELGDDLVLLRPLLAFRREELRTGLCEIGQSWREDASNEDDRFQRNWVRGSLLPMIRTRYPHADDAILRAIESQSQIREQIERDATEWIRANVAQQDDSISSLRTNVTMSVLAEVVRLLWDHMKWPRQSMGTAALRRLHATVTNDSDDSFTLPHDIQCKVTQDRVTLKRER
jgi:tRNA(Ile)-lysidine synthase